ncbi:hypothetical protein [Streptomyces canus]|uniref:hypothetical protein n=1 Tax=Streptomyces canus TaxID=58343 RepID=UPI003F6ACF48
MEGPEAELPGFGAPGVEEEAAELTAPDGVTPLSPVSAPPPPGWHPATASAAEATTTATAEPRIPLTYRMLSPEYELSGVRLLAALVEPDRTVEPAVLPHSAL